ncbi:hypothetical protein LX15_002511 [Streptoalloteichus tenebrarius]|uniref:Uncharacterized protein n=1 Tax=Streptoalloteichus tenebrarius (strain ATCC 17920 / DSM 40477 / JCM 4838 / CBS 697.72 / NBRC 16177 / NCIMB 11028 / NRRL B-12390 / A12253. 1 / ISP 5477) TaxID=1933 RepID=A0ABT1HTG7_STRSD|nr:hypothetical protein [Streptoalloteichus tenebrarius]MCP2258813.1 hypothetical protein [Streptoalloteichus tenebrarius]BFE99506.1 hypothetical protein GCM10020241_11820 [Streptoalloteichus tenebrarius]
MNLTEPVHKLRFMAMALAQSNHQRYMGVAHFLYPVTHMALNNVPGEDDWITVGALRRAGISCQALTVLEAEVKRIRRVWLRPRYRALKDTPEARDILTAARNGIAGPTDTVDSGHVLVSAFLPVRSAGRPQ